MLDAFTAGVLVVESFRAVLSWSNGFYSGRFAQNCVGIATAEDAQRSIRRNVRGKIR